MISIQYLAISVFVLSSVGIAPQQAEAQAQQAQQTKPPSATLYVGFRFDESRVLREQIEQLRTEVEESDRAYIELDRRLSTDALRIDGNSLNVHQFQVQHLRQESRELEGKIKSLVGSLAEAKAALEQGNQAIEAMVWKLGQTAEIAPNQSDPTGASPGGSPTDLHPRLLKKIAELKAQRADLSSQYGPSHPKIRSLDVTLKAYQKASRVGQPNGKLDAAEIVELKSNRADLVTIFGPDHPNVKSIDAQLKAAAGNPTKPVANDNEKAAPSNPLPKQLKSHIQNMESQQKKLQAALDEKRKKLAVHSGNAEKFSGLENELEEARSQLTLKETKLRLSLQRQKELIDQPKLDFDLVRITKSPAFVRKFAVDHKTLLKAKGISSLDDLSQRIMVEPDRLGQPNVYRLSFVHESELFSKAAVSLLLDAIKERLTPKRDYILTGQNRVSIKPDGGEIRENMLELKNSMAAIEREINALESKGSKDGLKELKTKRGLIQRRFEHLEGFTKIPSAPSKKKNPILDLQVLHTQCVLRSEEEAGRYKQLRTEHPELPELEFVERRGVLRPVANTRNGNESSKCQVTTVSAESSVELKIGRGRQFDKGDFDGAGTVCIISKLLGQKLFPASDPIGKPILVGAKHLRVIGVSESANDEFLYTPHRFGK